MTQPTVPVHGWRLAGGVALSLLGAGIMAILIFVFNCSGAACERAMFELGLAGSALLALVGQFVLILGLRMVWVALREDG